MSSARKKSVRRKGQAVTIDQVAARAGVSPMTVSRVVNHSGSVREATRERVKLAVKALGYMPNLAASSLAAAHSGRLALIYTNPSAAYLRELLVGALRGTARKAVQLVVDDWDSLDAEARRLAARSLARGVAGVILPPPLCESRAVVGELLRAGVPVVAIASDRFSSQISSVHIDDYEASRDVAAHVIAMGHTRIGYIKGDPNQSASERRYEGFLSTLREAGIAPDPRLVQQGHFTYRSGMQASEKLLSLRRRPTAIIASNDDMAAATVAMAHRCGLDVPRDLSVIGFDDTSAATMSWPELSTIRQPIAAMADSAIDILLRQIRSKDGAARAMVDHVVPHVLVKRGSVAAPAAGR